MFKKNQDDGQLGASTSAWSSKYNNGSIDMDAHMEGISSSIIVQAVNGLTAEYPDPSMLHLSTLSGTPRQQEDTVLVAIIFAAHTA
jgi:hypothetical protein